MVVVAIVLLEKQMQWTAFVEAMNSTVKRLVVVKEDVIEASLMTNAIVAKLLADFLSLLYI